MINCQRCLSSRGPLARAADCIVGVADMVGCRSKDQCSFGPGCMVAEAFGLVLPIRVHMRDGSTERVEPVELYEYREPDIHGVA